MEPRSMEPPHLASLVSDNSDHALAFKKTLATVPLSSRFIPPSLPRDISYDLIFVTTSNAAVSRTIFSYSSYCSQHIPSTSS